MRTAISDPHLPVAFPSRCRSLAHVAGWEIPDTDQAPWDLGPPRESALEPV